MELRDLPLDGDLTWAELCRHGLGVSEIRQLLNSGELVRLARDAYLPGHVLDAAPDRFARARLLHRRTTAALVNQFDGRAAASHTSAAVLHELPLWRASLDDVHLTRVADRNSRHRSGAVLHRQIPDQPLQNVDGVLAVGIADAIVGVGLLDRSPHGIDMLIAADHALRQQLVTRGELDEATTRHRGFRGMSRVHQLAFAEPLHESAGETRLGLATRLLGLASTPQVEHIIDGVQYRVDRQLDDWPVVLEMDGLAKYGADPLEQRRALEAQKVREEALRSIGLVFVRMLWGQLGNLPLLRRRIHAAIDECRARVA
ncbi:hypothetical protein [Aestuariimicrobium ganziense]|uniref:hypothetical protein n=1 Tax=Aestuariimicrobium ganziense TaxID=2773677 RepID=UPI001940AD42|nr:hypothetical protein [Aestuariimicrobium ganziense]